MDERLAHRGRSIAEMVAIQARMGRVEQFAASISDYRPQATDIIISPYGKCGTTWLQQTFHTLRTGGDMDFDDISRVVPWIETSRMLGIDINAPQRAEPRGFKSHLSFDRLPKGARYVICLRNPKDALVSMYHFMEGWFFEPGTVSLGDFYQHWLKGGAAGSGYWQHLISWWEQRDNPDVLLLSYEDMTAHPAENVRRLAAFCNIALNDSLLALTLERSSLAFMLRHKDRFDDAMMRKMSEERCKLPPGSDSAKVRKGGVGGHRKELPAEVSDAMDAVWTSTVTPRLEFPDYATLETELRRHLSRSSAN